MDEHTDQYMRFMLGSCRKFRLLTWTSFIGQFVHPVGWEGMDGWGCIVIIASCEYPFIRVHAIKVQHQSNNKHRLMHNLESDFKQNL